MPFWSLLSVSVSMGGKVLIYLLYGNRYSFDNALCHGPDVSPLLAWMLVRPPLS